MSATRADIVLHKGAYATVQAEMARRGTGISATIDSLIHEWQLLRRIQDAQRFRHDTRGDLNAITLNAQLIATVPPGRQRDEALQVVRDRAQAVKDRLVLVTAL